VSLTASGGMPGRTLGAALVVLVLCLASPCVAADAQNRGGNPEGIQKTRPGEITPDRLERWRQMTPEERERVRERYRRWKELPPEQQERILERRRRWRELPESERNYLRERREIYRNAWPEEKAVINKFFRRWRELPPERRQALKRKFVEWRVMPAAERDEQMMNWPFYRNLPPDDQRVIRRFLFSEPVPQPSPDRRNSPGNAPPAGPGSPGGTTRPPRE